MQESPPSSPPPSLQEAPPLPPLPKTDLPPYSPDPRDDTDSLAPPAHLRESSYHYTHETYVRRRNGITELRAKVTDFEQRQRAEAQSSRKDPSTPQIRIHRRDDDFLIIFLRSKKFRVEDAFKEYINFCRSHTENPWLRKVDLDLVERLFSSGSFQILPRFDRRGRILLFMDIKVLMPFVERLGKDRSRDVLCAIFGMLETIMTDVRTQIFGMAIISDLTGCKLRTFGYLTLQQYMLSLELCQHCYPIRARGMYFIHEPWYVRGLFNAMRPFMKSTVKETLRCFGTDVSAIQEFIPRESLTPRFGGVLQYDVASHTRRWVEAVRQTIS